MVVYINEGILCMVQAIKRSLLTAAVLLASLVVVAPAAQAAGRSVVYGGPHLAHSRHCPTTNCGVKAWIPDGTRYTMYCYRWGQNYTGRYTSSMWFYGVDDRSGLLGWIHSSYVSNQTSVGYCP